jgi:glutamine synthetase
MARAGSIGRDGFVSKHGLWTDEQAEAGALVLAQTHELGLETVRLSFSDQHGILRGKTLMIGELELALASGCSMPSSLLLKDTSHSTMFPIWTPGAGLDAPELTGAGDILMVADPTTFRVLPWSGKTGWLLCDIYYPDGRPVPYSSRAICQNAVRRLGEAGYDFLSGIEIEFHLFKLEDRKLRPEQSGMPGDPPDVSQLAHGYQYLAEFRMDEMEPVIDLIRRDIVAMGLPLRTVEIEFGPSQVEFTFAPLPGIESADLMVLFRSAAKQICRRHGYHASFMCRPAMANLFSCGWHLHQSLLERGTGANAFTPGDEGTLVSPLVSSVGEAYVAGLLEHAAASCLFTTPTINGYKRYRPETLAPDRILWARDNRGAMIRAIGGPGDAGTRLENRVGESAANPHLYIASQIIAGLDGIEGGLVPPPPDNTPYATEAPALPRSLMDAVVAFRASEMFRRILGDAYVDYLAAIKEGEISRYLTEVTDWEQREYFEIF